MPKKRVMLVASGGGHWVQLSRLSPAFEDMEVRYVTTMKGTSAPSGRHPVAVVRDASRSSPVALGLMALQLLGLLVKFRPEVIVTTGAAPGLIALQLGKLMGARTVWIDSIANAEELSLSGKLAGRFVDLWLTQWPHLAGLHPKLQHYGAVL